MRPKSRGLPWCSTSATTSAPPRRGRGHDGGQAARREAAERVGGADQQRVAVRDRGQVDVGQLELGRRAGDVQSGAFAVGPDRQDRRRRLYPRLADQPAGGHAVPVQRRDEHVPEQVVADRPDRVDLRAELGEVDAGARRGGADLGQPGTALARGMVSTGLPSTSRMCAPSTATRPNVVDPGSVIRQPAPSPGGTVTRILSHRRPPPDGRGGGRADRAGYRLLAARCLRRPRSIVRRTSHGAKR
jgi:hypothetical protein